MSNLKLSQPSVYRQFEKVVRLTVNERAKGSDVMQEDFRDLQIAARDGNCSVDEWTLLLTRTPAHINDRVLFEKRLREIVLWK